MKPLSHNQPGCAITYDAVFTFGDRQIPAQFIDAQGLVDPWETTLMAIRGRDVENPNAVQRIGLVTQFSWQVIPEPTFSNLVLLGAVLWSACQSVTTFNNQSTAGKFLPVTYGTPMRQTPDLVTDAQDWMMAM